ncbi:PREDICTED: uncharacterized protein LOC108381678 [Rhagoletis zephyria]|uniref:uncharacterized protein LOC108381678 n=1 Tax=Rhagoletis zephyria TaxID=28612 RepID=UPI000811206E|nr:PREDICTED: uncharacterized protein LOC108381678 [Rhagoletis zephyria]
MDEMDWFLLKGLRKGKNGTPMAQNRAFVWVLFGNAISSQKHPDSISTLYCDTQLTQLITRFWELEELQPKKHYTSVRYCEKLVEDTTKRAGDGRFIVRLPLKKEVPIGESRAAAVRALLRMERIFAASKGLHEEYSKFMQELIDLGHMEPAGPVTQATYYIPHHAVVRETSTTSSYSLNDALMVGPRLQQDLFSILVRFRTIATVLLLTSRKCIGRSTLLSRMMIINVLYGVDVLQSHCVTTVF